MIDNVKTNIMYLIRDMRYEFASMNGFLSSYIEDNSQFIVIVRAYIELILKQINLLDSHYDNPEKFSNDIKCIKLYNGMINKFVSDNDNDILYAIYINSLNGSVYCDEIINTYVKTLSDESLSLLNQYNEYNEENNSRVIR